jgi:hypothetical protein
MKKHCTTIRVLAHTQVCHEFHQARVFMCVCVWGGCSVRHCSTMCVLSHTYGRVVSRCGGCMAVSALWGVGGSCHSGVCG